MAHQPDSVNGDIVINGFEAGIGDSPYAGITDMRNINPVSVPSEAAVNFSTSSVTPGAFSGSVTSVSSNVLTFSGAAGIENYTAIYFTSVGSYSGLARYTPYWIGNLSGSTFKLYSDYLEQDVVSVTGTGTASFTSYQIGVIPSYVTGGLGGAPTYFAQPTNITASTYPTFLVDGTGLVWSNYETTTSGKWTYTGNKVTDGTGGTGDEGVSNASGNGLVLWRVTDGTLDEGGGQTQVQYLFVFRNSQIDYFIVSSYDGGPAFGAWTYGWNPATGTTGNSAYLTTPVGLNASHAAIIHPNGILYFCDGDNIGQIFQNVSQTMFDPSNTATYTYSEPQLLPFNDASQCLAPLGTNLLIGASGNIVYQWDTVSPTVSNSLILPESFTAKMVTVDTNTYIFIGNRGRIYITNGSQSQFWKKIPDHLSETVEPYFRWGGACYNKDQIFCSFYLTANAGSPITTMSGLWAIDTNTQCMRLANQLSYGTYQGFASAMTPQIYNPMVGANGTGAALFIGWDNGSSGYGIDTTVSNLYTAGQSYLISDLVPVGTAIEPATPSQIEFKLSAPLVSGESVELQVATNLTGSFTSVQVFPYLSGQTTISGITNALPVQEFQWIMVKAILTAASSNPSFVRLTELRIKGSTAQQTGYYNLQ